MPRYSAQKWREARTLVVTGGHSYEDAAERTGISASAIAKRASREGWQADREAAAHRRDSYLEDIQELKVRALAKALESMDPQDIHAWRNIETAHPDYRNRNLTEGQQRALIGLLIEGLVEYCATECPDLLIDLRPHLKPLAEDLVSRDWRGGA